MNPQNSINTGKKKQKQLLSGSSKFISVKNILLSQQEQVCCTNYTASEGMCKPHYGNGVPAMFTS